MQDFKLLESGKTTFGQLYEKINNMGESLRSQFAGTAFPASPVVGQPCYREDKRKLYAFDGEAWVDPAQLSETTQGVLFELAHARGEAASLQARLNVALNLDGTLKGDAPASDWWTEEADAVARFDVNSFEVAGDKRALYTPRRAILLYYAAKQQQGWIISSMYANNRTVVTVNIDVLPELEQVAYGQIVGNEPASNLPEITDDDYGKVLVATENGWELQPQSGVPLGITYYILGKHAPDDHVNLTLNNGEILRETYKDLFAELQRQGAVRTEAEWQAEYAANDGVVGFCSDGNGATTFRLPILKGIWIGCADPNNPEKQVGE